MILWLHNVNTLWNAENIFNTDTFNIFSWRKYDVDCVLLHARIVLRVIVILIDIECKVIVIVIENLKPM